jgi:hypothetical protein
LRKLSVKHLHLAANSTKLWGLVRVTRLSECSSIERLFFHGQFLKITEVSQIFGPLFTTEQQTNVGYILGDFFTNSSDLLERAFRVNALLNWPQFVHHDLTWRRCRQPLELRQLVKRRNRESCQLTISSIATLVFT